MTAQFPPGWVIVSPRGVGARGSSRNGREHCAGGSPRVLLEHGLADEVIVGYVARTWALDDRHCDATIAAARFLLEQEQAARRRADHVR